MAVVAASPAAVARNARRTIVLRDGEVIEDTTDFEKVIPALHYDPDAQDP